MLFVVLHHIISECEIEFTDLLNADGSIWHEHLLLVVIANHTHNLTKKRGCKVPILGIIYKLFSLIFFF